MKPYLFATAAAALLGATSASAADFVFDTDPFAGDPALTTPGRQIVGGEPFITFDSDTDRFVFDTQFFALGPTINFANAPIGSLPAGPLNAIVLETFDDDGDPTTPFLAGSAASLIAANTSASNAGVFVYFNSVLDMPRLVYSTNLGDPDADLKILARMTNLQGNSKQLLDFKAGNFALVNGAVPEPATWAMMLLGFGAIGGMIRSTRRRQRLAVSYA